MPPAKSKTPSPVAGRPADQSLRELVRVFGLLERFMQPYFAQFGISGAQWGVLRNLHRAEQEGLAGLRLTELGERLLIRPPSVTGVVDRLERVGLVKRDGLPADLRAKQVVLTLKGQQTVEQVLKNHETQIDTILDGLSLPEQAELHRLLSKLGQHLERLLQPERLPPTAEE